MLDTLRTHRRLKLLQAQGWGHTNEVWCGILDASKTFTKLTQDFSTYAGWRAAIEVALQLADSRKAAWRWDTMPARIGSGRDSDGKECLSRISDPGGVRNDIGESHAGRRAKEWEKW